MLTMFQLIFSLSLTDFLSISLKEQLRSSLFLILFLLNLHQLFLYETQACQAPANDIGLL